MLSLTPYCDIRHDDPKNGGGMWPQCGANRLRGAFLQCGKTGKNCRCLAAIHKVFHRALAEERMVDKADGGGLYTPLWTRRRLAR
jgi:hypothetical protein